MTRRARLTGLLAIAALAGSCFRLDTRAQDGRIALLESWGDDVILEGYAEFERRATTLREAAGPFCNDPSPAGLLAVREAWSGARRAWKRMDVFAFGPYSDVPLRIGPQIDFWPARPEEVESLVASGQALTAEAMPGYGAALRGLPALEVALWGTGALDASEFTRVRRRCDYLRAATADLVTLAGGMHEAWDPASGGYLLQLTHPGENGSMYMTPQEALAEVVNRIGFTVENIRNEKLGRPLGATTGQAQPDKTESPFSGRAIEDILDALDGIEVVLEGGRGGASMGLQDYLRRRKRADFEALVRVRLRDAREALGAIERPLGEAVLSEKTRVQAAIDALGAFQRLIQTDIIAALSLSLAFNDADGD